MIGITVSHYRDLEKMCESGMGVVYEAKNLIVGAYGNTPLQSTK
jgi:hypothetical protein